MGMVIPWNDVHNLSLNGRDVTMSPFTLVFQKAGLKGADSVVNAVILITVSHLVSNNAFYDHLTCICFAIVHFMR